MKMNFSTESLLSVPAVGNSSGIVRTGTTDPGLAYTPVAPGPAGPVDPALLRQQREQVAEAVKEANQFFEPINRNLKFSIDQDTEKLVVKVVDTATNQVVKQIPGPEMLAISRALMRMKGVMVDQKV